MTKIEAAARRWHRGTQIARRKNTQQARAG